MAGDCDCGAYLFSEDEIELGVCERCADRMYERYQKRREWEHFHPGEPCPKEELK